MHLPLSGSIFEISNRVNYQVFLLPIWKFLITYFQLTIVFELFSHYWTSNLEFSIYIFSFSYFSTLVWLWKHAHAHNQISLTIKAQLTDTLDIENWSWTPLLLREVKGTLWLYTTSISGIQLWLLSVFHPWNKYNIPVAVKKITSTVWLTKAASTFGQIRGWSHAYSVTVPVMRHLIFL